MQLVTLQGLLPMRPREFAWQAISFGLIVASALAVWKTLILVSGSESPIVVVLSGSMQPAFYKGDLLFLAEAPTNLTVGDIVVFKIPTKEIPVVHRVVNVHQRTAMESEVLEALTKGDNNELDDRKALIYTPDMRWVERQHLIGKVHGFLPYVGYLTIVMTEFPPLKYLLICVMAFFVIMKRESSSSNR